MSAGIGLVEARVYEDVAMKRLAAKGRWARTEFDNDPSFKINLDRKLRGNDKYTVELGFYSPIGRQTSDTLAARLSAYLFAYVDQVWRSAATARLTSRWPK